MNGVILLIATSIALVIIVIKRKRRETFIVTTIAFFFIYCAILSIMSTRELVFDQLGNNYTFYAVEVGQYFYLMAHWFFASQYLRTS